MLTMSCVWPCPTVRTVILLIGRHSRSGMLPGHISGHYTYDECHVDLSLLATFAKARLIIAKAENIDLQVQRDSDDLLLLKPLHEGCVFLRCPVIWFLVAVRLAG